MTTNTLAPIIEYRALATDTNEVLAVVRENLGNDKVTDRDLDRIILEGISWRVPTLEGPEPVKSLEGIIVHWTTPSRLLKNSEVYSGLKAGRR